MSDVGELHYAAREPWGGSAGMFETVSYLQGGNVRLVGPEERRLEAVLAAPQVERFLRLRPTVLERFLRPYEEVMPEAAKVGQRTPPFGSVAGHERRADARLRGLGQGERGVVLG